MSGKVETQVLQQNGQDIYKVTIGTEVFTLPFKQLGGKNVAFLDISGQVSLIEACAENLVEQLLASQVEFDIILNPVSKSNALAHAIAVHWAKKTGTAIPNTVVARKSTGSTGTDNSIAANYQSVTTPSVQTLLLTEADARFVKGKKLLVVDDVFGGGGTFSALQQLVDAAGASVAVRAVVAIEDGAKNTEGMFHVFMLPVL